MSDEPCDPIWFEAPQPTSYGFKRIFAIEQNLAAMIGRWPVEHLLVVSRTCKIAQPEPVHFLTREVDWQKVANWYPVSLTNFPGPGWAEEDREDWRKEVLKCQRRLWRAFLAELRDIFKKPSRRNVYRLGDKMAEWFRVVEFRWHCPGRLKLNSIHTHELWAMRDPAGLGFNHEEHRLWRKAEKSGDLAAARRHMMARNPSAGLREVWQILAHAKEAYGLHGRFDCFPA